jgi:hypothetical protein
MDAHATPTPNYTSPDQFLVDTTDYNVSYPPGPAYAPDHSAEQEQYYASADHQQQQYYSGDQQQQQQQYFTDDQYYAPNNYLSPSAAGQQAFQDNGNAYESYNQYYSTSNDGGGGDNGYTVSPGNQRPSLSPHPYSHPHASGVPPSAMHDFAARDSYQPSLDSFYGAAGTAH